MIYTLPDNNKINIDTDRYKCPEILFNPQLAEIDTSSLQECIIKSIEKCDSYLRKDLRSNIILSGGNTMFKNFESRLNKELRL